MEESDIVSKRMKIELSLEDSANKILKPVYPKSWKMQVLEGNSNHIL